MEVILQIVQQTQLQEQLILEVVEVEQRMLLNQAQIIQLFQEQVALE
tara:strand:- start:36 stop:176 length:141 start_codon:yes stop_codon:yes gene_type:complete